MPALDLLGAAGPWIDSLWLVFTWVVLVPALATGLIVVAFISARGEKRDNEKHTGRWGRAAQQRRDGDT